MMSLRLVSFSLMLIAAAAQQVQLGDTTIQGTFLADTGGRISHAYLGIPFAEAPVGDLRFSDPVMKDMSAWKGKVLDATSVGPMCPQDLSLFDKDSAFWLRETMGKVAPGHVPSVTAASEDCLTLDIYTPATPLLGGTPRPVLLWIHGGAFDAGCSWLYDGRVLANEADAVVVVIQYRLGVFGFYSANAGGNWGLKDQTLAMKWVQANIGVFGGDPDSVTIFGESAGGISVGMHTISPLSNGLFHRGILESGTELMATMYTWDPLASAKRLGQQLNCPTEPADALTNCIRQVSSEEIFEAITQIMKAHKVKVDAGEASFFVPPIQFHPSVDGEFFPSNPLAPIASNPVDIVVGLNNDEFGFMIPGMTGMDKPLSNDALVASLGGVTGMMAPGNEEYSNKLLNAIKEVYDHHGNNEHGNMRAFQHFISDSMFRGPAYGKADNHAADGRKVWMYHVNNGGSFAKNPAAMIDQSKFRTQIPKGAIKPGDVGADHGDEIMFVFGHPFSPEFADAGYQFTRAERALSKQIMQLWGKFARGESPWTPYNPEKKNVIMFDHLSPVVEAEQVQAAAVKLWTKTVPSIMGEMTAAAAAASADDSKAEL